MVGVNRGLDFVKGVVSAVCSFFAEQSLLLGALYTYRAGGLMGPGIEGTHRYAPRVRRVRMHDQVQNIRA